MNISKNTQSVLALVAMLPVVVAASSCFEGKPVAGSRISVTNFANQPSRNSVSFLSKDAANLTVPARQSKGDPTMHGASIALSSPMTGQADGYSLPAENWTALPAPEEGYRYIDVHHSNGPCEYVAVFAGNHLAAICRGAGVHFMLDEPHQGTLNFSLTLGTAGGTHYCASFGGQVMRDVPMSQANVGRFLAMHAPAPPDCNVHWPCRPSVRRPSGSPSLCGSAWSSCLHAAPSPPLS